MAGGPRIAAVQMALPKHVHTQTEIIAELQHYSRAFSRFAQASGVHTRHLALPIDQYRELDGFTAHNNAFIEAAVELGEQAVLGACEQAGITPQQIDLIASTTVTGLAVPSLEARIAARLGMRPDVKRMPLFGLGCVAGAAGVARMADYLRGHPDHVAVLLAVELCTLALQRSDTSAANLVATSLFGDGAAAVVMTGDGRGPEVLASRSRMYPDSLGVMGWDIGTEGFRIVLSTEVAPIAERYLGDDVRTFLKDHAVDEIATWVCHPGGPKVIEAIERALSLPADALDKTRFSLGTRGNLSSVSVLDVLCAHMAEPPAAGEHGVMIAMGPGFCSELVLLRW